MSMNRRYTDDDVRQDPSLQLFAEAYADHYTGDFEFLQSVRDRVRAGKGLTVPMARGVLNCVLIDPTVDAPVPDPVVKPRTKDPRNTRKPRTKDPAAEEHWDRTEPRMPAVIKVPFGMASQGGTVLHRPMRNAQVWWEWDDYRARTAEGFPPKRVLYVQWAGHPASHKTKNPVLLQERPEGVPYCRTGCFIADCDLCGAERNPLPFERDPDDTIPCRNCGAEITQQL